MRRDQTVCMYETAKIRRVEKIPIYNINSNGRLLLVNQNIDYPRIPYPCRSTLCQLSCHLTAYKQINFLSIPIDRLIYMIIDSLK